mgnify:CR=1 FL=1
MQAYRWTAERVLRELNSAPGGLSRKQAAARLAKRWRKPAGAEKRATACGGGLCCNYPTR